MKNSVWIVISILLLVACSSKPEFTRIIDGKSDTNFTSADLYYEDTILVKNTPKDTLEQIKMMIAYYDSVGMSLSELKQRKKNVCYAMNFIKDTKATRKRYLKREKYVETDPNITDIGHIVILQMDENGKIAKALSDSAKWIINIYFNLGNEPYAEYVGVNYRRYLLYDESDPDWWEHHKDSTMLQYGEPIWRRECKDGRLINYFKKLQRDKLK